MEIALEKKNEQNKGSFPIIKFNLSRSCYVYNSTGYAPIRTELCPYKTNSFENLLKSLNLKILESFKRSFEKGKVIFLLL